jgi:cysteine desulfurase
MHNQTNLYSGYFDYAAATPIDPRVQNYLDSIHSTSWANPSSFHSFGRKSKALLENSREQIAKVLHCKSNHIIFVPSITIANNLIIKSFEIKDEIIISNQEHASIKNQKANFAVIKKPFGQAPTWQDIEQKISDKTRLISLIWVNNETGTITDVESIANELKNLNIQRQIQNLQPILFAVDAAQAPNYLEINLEKLSVDFLALSSQKIYSPRGAAVLYAKDKTLLKQLIQGGNQENGLWSGTENVYAICGFAKALELSKQEIQNSNTKLKILYETIENFAIHEQIKIIKGKKNIFGILYLVFDKDFKEEELITFLDLHGFALSSGSACSSGGLNKNNFLNSEEEGLRISLGRYTTNEYVNELLKTIKKFIDRFT